VNLQVASELSDKMTYLILCVLSIVIFTQSLRLGQKREANVIVVAAVNYVAAALFSLIGFLCEGIDSFDHVPWLAAAAIVNGVLYFIHILIVMAGYRVVGVGITSALVGSGVIVPVLISWFAWSEIMTPYRWIAVGLVPLVMTLVRPHAKRSAHYTLKADVILFLCFFVAGVVFTIHKSVNVYFPPSSQGLYQFMLFTAAAISSSAYVIAGGYSASGEDFLLGVGAGLSNSLATLFLLLSLTVIPAVVFYPTNQCLVIAVNVVLSRILWGEWMVKRQIVGLALAVAIIILANVF